MRPLTMIGLIALVAPTANCASSHMISSVAPPRLEMPAQAARPCELYLLPAKPTEANLEIGYATRGAQLVACDGARRLAVETYETEHRLQDRRAATRKVAWWRW